MNTFAAGMMGALNRGREQKVFDWDKAARIIKDERPYYAEAGLKEDYGNTCGTIYEDGDITTNEGCCYLASTWATPVLVLINDPWDDGRVIPCYRMQSEVPEWDYKTFWPKSAVDIYNA